MAPFPYRCHFFVAKNKKKRQIPLLFLIKHFYNGKISIIMRGY